MTKHQKIVFSLTQDEDGYPPVPFEGIWAVPLSTGNFRIDNIPFYAAGISSGDEVAADLVDGELQFRTLVRKSDNSTFRLLLKNPSDQAHIRDELAGLGCESEFNQLIGLIAVEIPGGTSIHPFLDYILDAKDKGILDFEESALRHDIS